MANKRIMVLWSKRMPGKQALIDQLTSLKKEALLMKQGAIDNEIFAKDYEALILAIQIIKEVEL